MRRDPSCFRASVSDQLCAGAGRDEAAASGRPVVRHDPREPLPAALRGGRPLE